jgi:rhamnosyltransferase
VRRRTVGIVGARGIDNYGGYERMLADLVPRLVQKGYRVRCTCEKQEAGDCPDDYMGGRLDYFPLKPPKNYTLRKAFELLYDSFFIAKYSLTCDIIYILGIYGGASLLIPRLLGRQVIVNTDGLEWKRAKYHVVEMSLIVLYFALSLNLASKIVVDNEQLRRCIGKKHSPKICYIPYGVSQQKSQLWDPAKLSSYFAEKTDGAKIEKGKYWLLVSRLEPENNIHVIVDGFVKARPNHPLIVVGDFTSNKYRDRVYQQAFNGNSSNIVFLGSIYDADVLWMLRQHCLAYIHGHSVGGTNPSLLEAMISENLIVAHDNCFNKEVCSRFAHYFSNSNDLSDIVTLIEEDVGGPSDLSSEAHARAVAAYSWDTITTSYDKLFGGDSKQEAGAHRETQARVSQKTEP